MATRRRLVSTPVFPVPPERYSPQDQRETRRVMEQVLREIATQDTPTDTGRYDIRNFGAAVDGTTDDARAWQEAMDQAARDGIRIVWQPLGMSRVGKQLVQPANVHIYGAGEGAIMKASDGATYDAMITTAAVGPTDGVGIFDITLDANGLTRRAAGAVPVTAVTRCVLWQGVTNFRANNVTVQNSLGSNSASAAAFGIDTTSSGGRIGIINAKSTGVLGFPSDGFYCSASDTVVQLVAGTDVTDTCAVLEGGSNCHIETVHAQNCSQPAAISSFGTLQADRLTIGTVVAFGWNSVVAGGININLVGTTANLTRCGIGKIAMVGIGAATAAGPAIQLRNVSSGGGIITDFTLPDVNVVGGNAQGFLTTGAVQKVRIGTMRLSQCAGDLFVAQSGASDVHVDYLDLDPSSTTTFGLATTNANEFHVRRLRCGSGTALAWAIYHFGTLTNTTFGSEMQLPASTTTGIVGSDAAAGPDLLTFTGGKLYRTKALNKVIDENGDYNFVAGAGGKVINLSRIISDTTNFAINNHANSRNNFVVDDASGNTTAFGTSKATGFVVGSDVIIGGRVAGWAAQTGASSTADLGASPTPAQIAQLVTAIVALIRDNHKLAGP